MDPRALFTAALVLLPATAALAGTATARMDAPTITLTDLRPDDGITAGYSNLPEYVLIWEPRSRSYDVSSGSGFGEYLNPYSVSAGSGGAGGIGFIFSNEQNLAYLLTPYTTIRISTAASVSLDLDAGESGDARADLSLVSLSASGGVLSASGEDLALSFAGGASPGGYTQHRDGLLTAEFSTGAAPAYITWSTEVDVVVDASGLAPPVPEPGTYALMLAGLAGLAWRVQRQRRAAAAPA